MERPLQEAAQRVNELGHEQVHMADARERDELGVGEERQRVLRLELGVEWSAARTDHEHGAAVLR